MSRINLLYSQIALAIIGLADSWYLAETAMTDTPLTCDIAGLTGCNTVAQSPYSQLFGIPLGVYGVLFYALLFLLVLAIIKWPRAQLERYLFLLTLAGALASVVFIFIQVFLIQALCVYCLVSALITFISFGMTWKRTVKTPIPEGIAP